MPEDNTTMPTSMPTDNNPAPAMPAPAAPVFPEPTSSDVPTASDVPIASDALSTPVDEPMPTPEAVAPPVDDTTANSVLDAFPPMPAPTAEPKPEIYTELIQKINDSRNVLIALSRDPSADEMAAAIGLSLYLDRLGKRATAIYSGTTPNALEFLKPEETFEPTVDTLQDFVIALNKDKADHLRYKLDGAYVKIFITPYRTRLSEEDLEFSYGDFNVDLVFALDVANGIDLDSALREHGRIMHDAVIINVTTGNPGKFGEIEWSDKSASSVSEMIAKLLYSITADVKIEKEEATAFLTGIVAATNRFSNAKTTPETMTIASRLMESGANQQLVSKNITPDVENEMIALTSKPTSSTKEPDDPTKLEIEHDESAEAEDNAEAKEDSKKEIDTEVTPKEHTMLDDLKAAEASLAQAAAETVPEGDHTALKVDSSNSKSADEIASEVQENNPKPEDNTPTDTLPPVAPAITPEPVQEENLTVPDAPEQSDQITKINDDLNAEALKEAEEDKYGHMLEEALEGIKSADLSKEEAVYSPPSPDENPASSSAPVVSGQPEVNGVPEINYMPMPDETILPPPPTPPIEVASPMPEPTPEPLGSQPAMQDQVYQPQASDPGAFKIPGM